MACPPVARPRPIEVTGSRVGPRPSLSEMPLAWALGELQHESMSQVLCKPGAYDSFDCIRAVKRLHPWQRRLALPAIPAARSDAISDMR